jgi:hypothetical protein
LIVANAFLAQGKHMGWAFRVNVLRPVSLLLGRLVTLRTAVTCLRRLHNDPGPRTA